MTTTLTVQEASLDGLNLSLTTLTETDIEFAIDSELRTILVVVNNQAASKTLTITTQSTSVQVRGYGTIDVADKVITIPASSTRYVGPFADTRFQDASGLVQASFSSFVTLDVAAMKIPNTVA